MYQRSRQVDLAGVSLRTPLLIPSVSSRGFPVEEGGYAESSLFLQYAIDDITDVLLVSAYDLHHGLIEGSSEFLAGEHGVGIDRPKLLVIDSGGYETGSTFEGGHVDRENRTVKAYDRETHNELVDRLPRDRPILAVSYDGYETEPRSYGDQIGEAQRFFASHPHLGKDLLLKVPTDRYVSSHSPNLLVPVAENLRNYDAIGFTEKELGDDLLSRLTTLAQLRKVLSDAGVQSPIHLFGSLDPLLTPLYFAAGAEIFDGLSWMRYCYCNGVAVHPDAGALIREEWDDRGVLRDAKRVLANIASLRDLKRRLERFAAQEETNFAEFPEHRELLERMYHTARARIGVTT